VEDRVIEPEIAVRGTMLVSSPAGICRGSHSMSRSTASMGFRSAALVLLRSKRATWRSM